MEWTEFVTALVGHLAWPVTVVSLSILFRSALSARLRSLLHFKGAGVEATFGTDLAVAEQNVNELLDAAGVPIEEPGASPRPEPDLSIKDPSGLIIRSWEEIVWKLEELRARTSNSPTTRQLPEMLRQLRQEAVIGSELVETVNRLRDLRNKVAHGKHEPTGGEALSYQESAHELMGYLQFLVSSTERGDTRSNRVPGE